MTNANTLINLGAGVIKNYIKDSKFGYIVAEIDSILENIQEKEIIEKPSHYNTPHQVLDDNICYKISSFTSHYDDEFDIITDIYLDNEGFPVSKQKKKKKQKKHKKKKIKKLFRHV